MYCNTDLSDILETPSLALFLYFDVFIKLLQPTDDLPQGQCYVRLALVLPCVLIPARAEGLSKL